MEQSCSQEMGQKNSVGACENVHVQKANWAALHGYEEIQWSNLLSSLSSKTISLFVTGEQDMSWLIGVWAFLLSTVLGWDCHLCMETHITLIRLLGRQRKGWSREGQRVAKLYSPLFLISKEREYAGWYALCMAVTQQAAHSPWKRPTHSLDQAACFVIVMYFMRRGITQYGPSMVNWNEDCKWEGKKIKANLKQYHSKLYKLLL